MRTQRIGLRGSAAVLGAGLVLMLASAAGSVGPGNGSVLAQQAPLPPQMPTPTPPFPTMGNDQRSDLSPAERARMEAVRVKILNDDRHKRMVQDANQLIVLSNELKTDIDKTSKDELSLEVIRKAAEIEKLAHDVQNRMKN